jgi:hypothetical protein
MGESVQVLKGYVCIYYTSIQINHAAVLHELSHSHMEVAKIP